MWCKIGLWSITSAAPVFLCEWKHHHDRQKSHNCCVWFSMKLPTSNIPKHTHTHTISTKIQNIQPCGAALFAEWCCSKQLPGLSRCFISSLSCGQVVICAQFHHVFIRLGKKKKTLTTFLCIGARAETSFLPLLINSPGPQKFSICNSNRAERKGKQKREGGGKVLTQYLHQLCWKEGGRGSTKPAFHANNDAFALWTNGLFCLHLSIYLNLLHERWHKAERLVIQKMRCVYKPQRTEALLL